MVYKIYRFFLKIASTLELIVINILFVSILMFFGVPAFSNDTNMERNLAYKYCKSIESNMFQGLDDERILKYEYFFNSVNKGNINESIESANNFTSEVENICSYELNSEEKENFQKDLKKFLSNN